jgi:hypothetical protein
VAVLGASHSTLAHSLAKLMCPVPGNPEFGGTVNVRGWCHISKPQRVTPFVSRADSLRDDERKTDLPSSTVNQKVLVPDPTPRVDRVDAVWVSRTDNPASGFYTFDIVTQCGHR